jgi:hypothetical protein
MIATGTARTYPAMFSGNALHTTVKYFPPKDNPIIGTFEGIEKCSDDFECTDVFSAKVSDTGIVTAENIDWISGNCTNAVPIVCTFNTGIFNIAPNCAVTRGSITGLTSATGINTLNSTSISYSFHVPGTGETKAAATIVCQKQGSDYKPKTAKAATTNEMMYVPNVTRPKTCYYAFGGASATLASPTECTASPCVEVRDNCSTGSAPTRSGVGLYDDLTFASGTWAANSAMHCDCVAFDTTTGETNDCYLRFLTPDNTWSTNASGGYIGNIRTRNTGATDKDSYVSIMCTANAP